MARLSLLASFDLSWQICCLSIMGKDRLIFDASSSDRCRTFKFFVANFRVFRIIEDYINTAKLLDSEDYWITTKRIKAMAALRRAFPLAKWDVLTTTRDSQTPDEDKKNPALWLAKFSRYYLGGEPIIQSTHTISSYIETTARNVRPSVAHFRVFGISEILPSVGLQIAVGHLLSA